MISVQRVQRRIQKHWQAMQRRDIQSDFVRGVIQGLRISYQIVEEVRREQAGRRCNNPLGITRRVVKTGVK